MSLPRESQSETTTFNGYSRKIFVGNLSYVADEQSLKDHFTGFGTITEIKILRDLTSGSSRGCAFVVFKTPEGAQAAMNGTQDVPMICGRRIRVTWAKNQCKKKPLKK